MPISLTKEQMGERLLEPHRLKLLTLAINEDVKSCFPIKYKSQGRIPAGTDINLDLTEALKPVVNKIIFRAIEIAYDESLD